MKPAKLKIKKLRETAKRRLAQTVARRQRRKGTEPHIKKAEALVWQQLIRLATEYQLIDPQGRFIRPSSGKAALQTIEQWYKALGSFRPRGDGASVEWKLPFEESVSNAVIKQLIKEEIKIILQEQAQERSPTRPRSATSAKS